MTQAAKNIKYVMILRPSDGAVLFEQCLLKKKKVKEAKKVANKLITSELEPDHRKKVVSPKYGVWIGECCKQNLLHICLLDYGISEELATEFLRRSKKELYNLEIEADHIPQEEFQEMLENPLNKLIGYFNEIDEENLDELKNENLNVSNAIPETELGVSMNDDDNDLTEKDLLGEGDGNESERNLEKNDENQANFEKSKNMGEDEKNDDKVDEEIGTIGEPIETEEKEKVKVISKKVKKAEVKIQKHIQEALVNEQDLDVKKIFNFFFLDDKSN